MNDQPVADNIEDGIQVVVDRLVDAWNRRDWASFSRLFAEEADYVTGSGSGWRDVHGLTRLSGPGSPGHPEWITFRSPWNRSRLSGLTPLCFSARGECVWRMHSRPVSRALERVS